MRPGEISAHELDRIERKLRDSGVFDGLFAANRNEAATLARLYAEWTLKLAPYLLADRRLDVAGALQRYRTDRDG